MSQTSQRSQVSQIFTIETANRALALIRPIVTDIVQTTHEAEALNQELKDYGRETTPEEAALVDRLVKKIEYHIQELRTVGVFLKDLHLGLVDFPCEHEGRLVLLCWMLGEEVVNSWHEKEEGITERRLVDESFSAQLLA
ncbi:hypothetical protein CO046_04190 [Candidatus Peregrinibacteria bacterium CG_4_9_14_0_2_um_filter_53_11]|nr:MAG: hypothetical protein CO046_04190 [Candidatus Peregrinibacteria bacterium CG_4_9_14_0_2_um_filter_53_11]